MITWAGSFEPDFSRNRKLARLLNLIDADVEVVREQVWGPDRIDLASTGKLKALARLSFGIPRLVWRLLRAPAPDLYFVSYPGWFDLPAVWLAGKVRRRPVVFDAFISLFDTLVVDRGLYSPASLVGRVARLVDRIALRLATTVLADTTAHLAYFDALSPGVLRKGAVLPLGADDSVFYPRPEVEIESELVLFHGTFVPLQGVTTVIDAARLLESRGVRFVLIGDGQDRVAAEERIAEHGLENVELVGLIPLANLPNHLAMATVCLGIFGDSPKAGRVVPNKVYECLALGRPIVTRESEAIDEMLTQDEIATVPPRDPVALAEAITAILDDRGRREEMARAGRDRYERLFHEKALAETLGHILNTV
jgi:glycosyltransferase involved in cell wall biosynthesis